MSGQSAHLDQCKKRLERFKTELEVLAVSDYSLTAKPSSEKWSAEECLQHLTVMWQCYRPQFDKGLKKAKNKKSDNYKMGWFGKWFAEKMKPDEAASMKTSKIFEPQQYASDQQSVERLKEVQDEILDYIERLRTIDINKSRISSPASALISLKMGDALEIILNHQDRHWQQALNAIEASDPKS